MQTFSPAYENWKAVRIGEQVMHLAGMEYKPTPDKVYRIQVDFVGAGPAASRLVLTHLAPNAHKAIEGCLKQLRMLGAVPIGEQIT